MGLIASVPTLALRRPFSREFAVFAGLALVLLVILPVVSSGDVYWLTVMTNACILAFGSMGVWLTFSIGRINIAQGGFALIGGYITAILTTRYALPFWITLPASAAASALMGGLIGWPILRLRGVYFAMITLSLTEVFRLIFLNGGAVTKGSAGITNIPRPSGLSSNVGLYLASVVLMLAGLAVIWRFSTSRIGWVFRSMRQNEDLASSLGIDVARYRVMAFMVACGMGGVMGAFFVVFQQNIFPSSYTVNDSVNFMLYCFLGGLDYVLGPVVGAFFLVIAFELLSGIQQYQALLYGVLMIACMLFRPNGLLSLLPTVRRRELPAA